MNLDLPNGKNRKPCQAPGCGHSRAWHLQRRLPEGGYLYVGCKDTRCACLSYVYAEEAIQ